MRSEFLKIGTLAVLALAIASLIFYWPAAPSRPLHNLSQDVFRNLPPWPEDFYSVGSSVASLSDLRNLHSMNEAYYKQPEFYPTFESYAGEWKPDERIGVMGIGAYPAEQNFNAARNEELAAAAFFHASWLVQTHQGIRLVPEYDERYMEVSVEPDEFLLGSSYPEFHENWTQKVKINVKIKNAPAGEYKIYVNPAVPSPEKISEWSAYPNYVSFSARLDRPYLAINIAVTG